MSNLEHLLENGLVRLEKHISYEEWVKETEKDPNWTPYIGITINELWEICQYLTYTYLLCKAEMKG